MKNHNYKIITTEDGTISLYSGEYGEAMHSVSGAYDEALLKHVRPSGILDLKKEEFAVLDTGSGIGYNMLALLSEFRNKKTASFLRIISLEKDFSFLPLMNDIHFGDLRDKYYYDIKNAFEKGAFLSDDLHLEVMRGDARASIQKTGNIMFDAVFHDPYSPAKNPELWTTDFFKKVYDITAPHGVLTTYSSAPQIRGALIEAGFRIGRGPSVGKKREGTIATKSGNIPFLSDDDISSLRNDPKSTPYRDPGLKSDREEILERRINEMRERKGKK